MLQKVVDRAYCKIENDKQIWVLSEEDAKEFVNCVDKYIKKSVFKSDIYDPEDAYGDIILELWRCLTKYGPRPNGRLFGEYVLPLKTNNILTNRANKRKSLKSRINYLITPMDSSAIENTYFELPLDIISLKERIDEYSKKISANARIISLFKKVKKELLKSNKNDVLMFNSMYLIFLDTIFPEILKKINTANKKVENDPKILYNHGRHLLEEIMREFNIGDKLITPAGKVIEIRRRTESGFIVNIPLIEQEVEIDFVYAKRCSSYDMSTDLNTEPVKDSPMEDVQVEETKQLKVYAKKIVEEEKKSLDNIVIEAEESGAALKLVIELLKTGPHSREALAKALVNKGFSKSSDIEKSKGYVSVLITNIKKLGQYQIESPKRGVYQLAQ